MRYWETLFDPRFMFDNNWRQRRDIIAAEDLASEAVEQGGRVLALTTTVQGQVEALQNQVHDLSITVMALVELLTDSKQIDSQELRARVEAAIAGERAAVRAAAETAAAERERLRVAAERANTEGVTVPIECTRCHARVPANQTTMTGDGVVCDNCAR